MRLALFLTQPGEAQPFQVAPDRSGVSLWTLAVGCREKGCGGRDRKGRRQRDCPFEVERSSTVPRPERGTSHGQHGTTYPVTEPLGQPIGPPFRLALIALSRRPVLSPKPRDPWPGYCNAYYAVRGPPAA